MLEEAGHILGGRDLEHLSPMLRGDDVADLQQRLCALGFDTDRVDGIFGGLTASAVAEFQENMGLVVNAIAGTSTIERLLSIGGRSDLARSVTAVRDGELRRSKSGAERHRRIGLSHFGAPEALMVGVADLARTRGLEVHVLGGNERTDPSQANALGVDLYLAISCPPEVNHIRTLFYSGYAYESGSGRALATSLLEVLVALGQVNSDGPVGMALPLLRETLMTAVVIELPTEVVEQTSLGIVAGAIVEAILSETSSGDPEMDQ